MVCLNSILFTWKSKPWPYDHFWWEMLGNPKHIFFKVVRGNWCKFKKEKLWMWRQRQKGSKSPLTDLVGKQMMTEQKAVSQTLPQGIEASTTILKTRNIQGRKFTTGNTKSLPHGLEWWKGNDKRQRWCRTVSVKSRKWKK